jgi:hypothetical protein
MIRRMHGGSSMAGCTDMRMITSIGMDSLDGLRDR